MSRGFSRDDSLSLNARSTGLLSARDEACRQRKIQGIPKPAWTPGRLVGLGDQVVFVATYGSAHDD